MTFSDLAKLIRHYVKLVIIVPVICIAVSVAFVLLSPPCYEAKATLLTNGDIALASGFAQSEAEKYSQNGIKVTAKSDTSSRTITITAEGRDYGGCIAASNATVSAASKDVRDTSEQTSISTNEATYAESTGPGMLKIALLALFVGLFLAVCVVVVIDLIKTPIKSKSDIETASSLPVIGTIPNRDRGERLLANVRFLSDGIPSTIAVVPVGYTGAALTCAELASAFECANIAVTRVKGSPHAQGIADVALPEIVTIVECAPIAEGMGGVYIAKDAEATILCASVWRDSRKALASIVEELHFAKAKVGGVVVLSTREI